MADVTTTFFANEQQAAAAIARLEKKYADLENAIGNVSKRSKQDANSIGDSMASWAKGVGAVAMGYLALPAIIGQVSAAQSELIRKADEAALKYDAMFRKFRIQAGLGELQGEGAKANIVRAAAATATDVSTAEQVSRQMVSQGFSTEDSTGAGLTRLLETMKATNAKPEQAGEVVTAYSALLAATGQEKNQANLEKVTRQIQGTFQASPLEAADLTALAPKIQGVSSVLSTEEALAQFAVIKGKTGKADTAATTLKMFWEKLGTSETNAQSVEALSKMGLSPGQVDAIGETPADVLDRMAAGLDKLAPEQRSGVMKQLFGEEAMSGATGLIRDRSSIQGFIDKMDNEAGFQEMAEAGMSGKAAGRERGKTRQELQKLSKDTGFEDYMQSLDALQEQAGYGEFRRSVSQGATRAQKSIISAATDTPESSLRIASEGVPESLIRERAASEGLGIPLSGSEDYKRIAKELIIEQTERDQLKSAKPEDYLEQQKRTNELLQQLLDDAKKKNAKPERKPLGEP